MLQNGYTAVAEFHYLHNAPDGKPYANRVEMAQQHLLAAQRTGIAITLLPRSTLTGISARSRLRGAEALRDDAACGPRDGLGTEKTDRRQPGHALRCRAAQPARGEARPC